MSTSFIPLNRYITKFYEKGIRCERFLGLSEEQLSMLSKKVYKMQEKMTNPLSQRPEKITPLEIYQKTLQYLTNPNICSDLRTFDERIAYLIMMTDPNLVTFKEFLKLDLLSMAEIDKVEEKTERERLMKDRKQTIVSYEYAVRQEIGFFDVNLLKYEEMFFKKFFSEKELLLK